MGKPRVHGSRDGALYAARMVSGASGVAALIGVVWLAAWLVGAPREWAATTITMKTNMAVGLLLAGVSLGLIGRPYTGRRRQSVGILLAAVVLGLGALTLGEHVGHVDFGIDQLLAGEPEGAEGTISPNRMGPPGSLALVLVGAGLLGLAARSRVAQYLGLAACAVMAVPGLGHLLGISELYGNPSLTAIAWSSVVALLALGLGLVAANPHAGPVAALFRSDPGGALARRTIPVAIVLPIALAFLMLHGRRFGLYGTELGVAILALTLVLVLTGLLWSSADLVTRLSADRERQAQALSRERTLLASVMKATDVMLVYLDRGFDFVWVNEAYAATCRMRPEEMVGKNHFALYPDAENEAIFARVRDTGEPVFFKDKPFEFPDQPERGVTYWDWSLVPMKDAAGSVQGLVWSLRETTHYKRGELALRASEERFRRLVEVSAQIVWVTNAQGEPVEDSPSWRAFTGRPLEQWLGWRWLDGVHPDDRARVSDVWRNALATKTHYEVEFRMLDAAGHYRTVEARAVPILDHDGAIREWIGTNRDVTERRQAEEAVRDSERRLRASMDDLQEADRRKNEFLAVLSHELRNPLAPIRSSVYVLGRATPGSEPAERALAVIDRQVTQMARLIDDLLDVTRISRGKVSLKREPLDLNEIVRGSAEDLREIFRRNDVALEVSVTEAPLRALADRTRIAQVVGNLLHNAAKFTPRGGHARLSLTASAEGPALIEVRDDGPGIEPGLIGKLFEPFVQAESTLARSQGGLGLGLALVKGLVTLHGGSVTVASDGAGRGSTFTVRLPLEATGPASATTPARESSRLPALRVLVIEDHRDGAASLKAALELAGHRVDVAETGAEGIDAARRLRPDVVICDLGLPGVDGFGVARALRADPDLDATVLVALSGYALQEDVERAIECGFDRHVPKPPDVPTLERVVGEARRLRAREVRSPVAGVAAAVEPPRRVPSAGA